MKDKHVLVGKKMARYGRKMTIYQLLFIEPIKILTRYAPPNDRLNLSFVKDEHTYRKKMARNSRTMVIYEEHSFGIRV